MVKHSHSKGVPCSVIPHLTLDLMEASGQSEREELFRQNFLGLHAEDVMQIDMLPVTLHCLPGMMKGTSVTC